MLHEVEQILHAVLADADTAALWAAGRLVEALDAADRDGMCVDHANEPVVRGNEISEGKLDGRRTVRR
ncbi:hypothetical protein ACFXD5_12780 [Streptomyces sp. NPDC059385]|uniref:hypothetical protein n=1 Tax=Streptomyces sp. NPDC059385 TaxID=3346817 RepID=UPI0036B369B1